MPPPCSVDRAYADFWKGFHCPEEVPAPLPSRCPNYFMDVWKSIVLSSHLGKKADKIAETPSEISCCPLHIPLTNGAGSGAKETLLPQMGCSIAASGAKLLWNYSWADSFSQAPGWPSAMHLESCSSVSFLFMERSHICTHLHFVVALCVAGLCFQVWST